MKEINSLEVKISVGELYEKFLLIASSEYYRRKQAHLFKDEKNKEYYLWNSKRAEYNSKEKITLTQLAFPLDEKRMKEILKKHKGNISEDELEKFKEHLVGEKTEKYLRYADELDEIMNN